MRLRALQAAVVLFAGSVLGFMSVAVRAADPPQASTGTATGQSDAEKKAEEEKEKGGCCG